MLCLWQEEALRPDPLAQALADLIASDTDKYLDKFNFRSEICISCDWRRMELSNRVSGPSSHCNECSPVLEVHMALHPCALAQNHQGLRPLYMHHASANIQR